jgi:NADH-quinone oxidoreductase subunit C
MAMTPQEIHAMLQARCGDAVRDLDATGHEARIAVDPERIDAVTHICKATPELDFKSLMCLSGVDAGDDIRVVYHLFSMGKRHRIVLDVRVPKAAPEVRSVTGVWRVANWFERECYDLFGVRFEGHPDLRRILLPEDWEGWPLRKEYVFPTEYGGIDNRRDYSI